MIAARIDAVLDERPPRFFGTGSKVFRVEGQGWGIVMGRCRLTGECLAGRGNAVGRPWRLALRAFDTHGNARGRGGEAITMDVRGPEGCQARAAAVQDARNGCYNIALTPDRPGRWVLHPKCARHP